MSRLDEINLYQEEENEWVVESSTTDSFATLDEARQFVDNLTDVQEVSLYEDEDNEWTVETTTLKSFPALDFAKKYFSDFVLQHKS